MIMIIKIVLTLCPRSFKGNFALLFLKSERAYFRYRTLEYLSLLPYRITPYHWFFKMKDNLNRIMKGRVNDHTISFYYRAREILERFVKQEIEDPNYREKVFAAAYKLLDDRALRAYLSYLLHHKDKSVRESALSFYHTTILFNAKSILSYGIKDVQVLLKDEDIEIQKLALGTFASLLHFRELSLLEKEIISTITSDDLGVISSAIYVLLGKGGIGISLNNSQVIKACKKKIEDLLQRQKIENPISWLFGEAKIDTETSSQLLDSEIGFEKVLLALANPDLDNDDTRTRAAKILGIMAKREALPALVQAFDRNNYQPTYRAARDSIIAIGSNAETIEKLSALLSDENVNDNFISDFGKLKHVSYILATWGDSRGYDFLQKGLGYGQLVGIEAAEMLAELGTNKSVGILAHALKEVTTYLSNYLECLDEIPLLSSRKAKDLFFRQLELDLKNQDASIRNAVAEQCMYGNNKNVLPSHIIQMAEQVLGS